MKIKKIIAAGIAAAFLLAFVAWAGPADAANKTVIRLASPFKTGHILCDAGDKFKEIVEFTKG